MRLKYVSGVQPDESYTPRELANRQLAYEAACEGIVLLENDGTLPLQPGKIALYGSGAISTIKGGTGSGEVNERYSVNIYDGLINAGFTVTSQSWLDEYITELEQALADYDQARIKAVKESKSLMSLMDVTNLPFAYPTGRMINEEDVRESDCDTAVYVVARQAGESGDKKLDNGDFNLFPEETAHLRFLSEHYKNTVLVINSGSSMDISPVDELQLSAVIFFCQQGEEGGNALGAILAGKVAPSGKLTDTWAKSYEDIPFGDRYSYLSGSTEKEIYHEGIYVGYRYFDSFQKKPRYPFGHGLSYTDFAVSVSDITAEGTKIRFNATVRNTGKAPGKEVVQAYISCPSGRLEREYKQLAAFAKTRLLAPDEEETIPMAFDLTEAAAYDPENAAWILESGSYVLHIGSSSDKTVPAAEFTLDQTVTVLRVKNCCVPQGPVDELHGSPRNAGVRSLPRIPIDTGRLQTGEVSYTRPEPVRDEDVAEIQHRLSQNDLIRLCVGAGVIGMFSGKKIVTPGTVGRTTDRLFKKGLINVNLSDGPAGIRILRRSCIKRGIVRMADYTMSFMKYLPNWIKRIIMADPEKDAMGYQFCTAFPVETSLAQTWNTELCERIGHAISVEMEAFNITYWLAPAMNIHRNPLCGRNFEYYSEDPLLTGKIAAAVVRGVQSIPGNYAVIKHFACNNQEDNRNRCDSIVGERALREIYLKGFNICIRESDPKAVMSSYNLLNGVYTVNSRELLTDILRSEWGFSGIVMSDWHSTNKGLADNGAAIAAGNDLIMPGGILFRWAVWKALRKKKLSRRDLELSASRIIRQIINSAAAKKYPPDLFR
ncbi:MAG: glycoside hydrolase family 3 C-terminal domain-containing protein [Flexilinea sp.]|nr:glycoside hydrolase family 3 C-terminal domain-containing protein [Flexilinea sp.]